MLTLLLHKDMAHAEALADGLDIQGEQLRDTLALSRSGSLQSLASPPGLLLCFAAGCALSLAAGALNAKAGEQGETGATALGLLLALARERMH